METQLNILKLGARMVRNFVSSIKRAQKTPPKLAKKKFKLWASVRLSYFQNFEMVTLIWSISKSGQTK